MKIVLKNKVSGVLHEISVGEKIADSSRIENKIEAAKESWAFGIVRKEWAEKGLLKDAGILGFDLGEENKKIFEKEVQKELENIEFVEIKKG